MARPATNPEARLHRLEAARPKLAGLRRGEVLMAKPMAALLGVSWPTLRGWCDDVPGFAASGAFVIGGNGVNYEFKPKQTVDYLIKHFRSVIDRQAKESRRITKAVGVDLPDAESAPSLAETKALVDLTITVTAAAERQRRYALADEVADFIEGYNETVVSGILGVRTKVDPNGNLPAGVRQAVDDHLRRVAAGVHARAQSYIEGKRAGIRQERAG